jgi:hypothetical protein
MTPISLKIQQPTGEVERHIDRANGVPAVEAAMCCDNGTKEIGLDSLLLNSRVRCTGEVQRHGKSCVQEHLGVRQEELRNLE